MPLAVEDSTGRPNCKEDGGSEDPVALALADFELEGKRKRSKNRASLVAGLQPGATEVSFHLDGCSKQEFTLLCKALEVQGPLVRSVTIKDTLDFY